MKTITINHVQLTIIIFLAIVIGFALGVVMHYYLGTSLHITDAYTPAYMGGLGWYD